MEAILRVILKSHKEMYSEERGQGLRSYKYRGVDKSPISKYILTPYWNWAVTLLPLWMAPNLVTLIGFLFIIAAYGLTVTLIPDLQREVHPAFYFFFALSVWIYSTMDNIDGKQARRTNSSSPLGELFDHGCDALNCPIAGIVQIAALGLGFGWRSLIVLFISCWAFYLPTWEEYHTGILYLGYINGPTEGLLAVMATMLISGIFGPSVWFRQITSLAFLGIKSILLVDLTLLGFLALFAFYYVPSCVFTVYSECRSRGRSFLTALTQLLPMVLASFSVVVWYNSKCSALHTKNFVLFFTTLGIAFGKLSTKIIYAHVAKCPFPMFTGLLIPLVLGAAVMGAFHLFLPSEMSHWAIRAETTYLWCYLMICLVGYGNWIYHTINSICMHCDIYCLQIKKKKPEAQPPSSKA